MTDVPHDSVLSKACSDGIARSLQNGRKQSLQLTLQDGHEVTVSTAGLAACLASADSLVSAEVTCNTGPAQLVRGEDGQWHLLWKVDLQEIRRQREHKDYLQKVARINDKLAVEMELIADSFDWNEK